MITLSKRGATYGILWQMHTIVLWNIPGSKEIHTENADTGITHDVCLLSHIHMITHPVVFARKHGLNRTLNISVLPLTSRNVHCLSDLEMNKFDSPSSWWVCNHHQFSQMNHISRSVRLV